MAVISRYPNSSVYSLSYYGSSQVVNRIRQLIRDKQLPYNEFILTGSQRLDTIAGSEYNDATLWWLIAAASDVGWGMQLPAGTRIRVPDLKAVLRLMS